MQTEEVRAASSAARTRYAYFRSLLRSLPRGFDGPSVGRGVEGAFDLEIAAFNARYVSSIQIGERCAAVHESWFSRCERRFHGTFTKLRALEPVEFRKILILDLDMIVIKAREIDNMCMGETACFRGIRDSYVGSPRRLDAQLYHEGRVVGSTKAGVMLLTPCEHDFTQMQHELSMDYFSRFYREWKNIPFEFTVAHGERRIQQWHVQDTLTAKTRKLSASGAMLTALCIYTCVRALASSPCGRDATRTAAVRVLLGISRGPMSVQMYGYIDRSEAARS